MSQSQSNDADNGVILYGSGWCPHTQRAFKIMDTLKVPYRYIDVDEDADSEALIASHNNGRAIRPTFDIQGKILVHPDAQTLQSELQSRGLMRS